jgi:hypothetical protein
VATTTARSRKIAKITSGVVGIGLGVVATLGFSSAAFTAQAPPNVDNNWASAGSVSLESEFTAPMFSIGRGAGVPWSGGAPLPSVDEFLDLDSDGIDGRTIDITFEGELDADIRMFVESTGTATNDLDEHTLVTVTRDIDGPGGATADTIYDGIALSAMPTSYAAAATVEDSHWNVNHDDTDKTATYTVSIKADGQAPADSEVTGVEFQWEAQR